MAGGDFFSFFCISWRIKQIIYINLIQTVAFHWISKYEAQIEEWKWWRTSLGRKTETCQRAGKNFKGMHSSEKKLSTDETMISLNLCTLIAPTQNYGKTCSRDASPPEFFHIPYALPWSFRADGDIIFWRLLETNNWECHDSLYEVYLWSVQNAGRSALHQGVPCDHQFLSIGQRLSAGCQHEIVLVGNLLGRAGPCCLLSRTSPCHC